MLFRSFIGGSCIAGAAARDGGPDRPGHIPGSAGFNMKTGKPYLSLTSNVSYYTTVDSEVQIPSSDLLDVEMAMRPELAKDCPNGMMTNEWCVAPGALATQFPGSAQQQFLIHGFLAGNHTITSVEPGMEGTEMIACHSMSDGYYCHTLDKFTRTYSVVADNGALGFGVVCHDDIPGGCHILGHKDVIVSKSLDEMV